MKHYVTTVIDASEQVRIKDRSDIDATVAYVGDDQWANEESLNIYGAAADRAAFLRRLAEAALGAAHELDRAAAEAERELAEQVAR